MPRVLVAGAVTWDAIIRLAHFPEPRPQTVFSQGFHETVGGTSAGKALNLRKLGFDVTLHALGAEDAQGRRVREVIEGAGVELLRVPDPQGTERHVNLMDANGARISIYATYASAEPALDVDAFAPRLQDTQFVVLDIANYCRRFIPAVKRAGKALWTDLHDWDGENAYHRDFADAADFVFLSSDALPDFRALMEGLRARGKQLVVCTHGRHGSTALTRDGQWFETPIAPGFERVDTNGAGDAFFAGVLWAHSMGHGWEPSLRIGTLVAGLCVASPELVHAELGPTRVADEYRRVYGNPLPLAGG